MLIDRYKVNLEKLTVEKVVEFKTIPGCSHNGQHYQLKGHALVEVEFSNEIFRLNLFHPQTRPKTGAVDLVVIIDWLHGEIIFENYAGEEIDLLDRQTVNTVWPGGLTSLILVIILTDQQLVADHGEGTGFLDLVAAYLNPSLTTRLITNPRITTQN